MTGEVVYVFDRGMDESEVSQVKCHRCQVYTIGKMNIKVFEEILCLK